jgi:hypothetical protein
MIDHPNHPNQPSHHRPRAPRAESSVLVGVSVTALLMASGLVGCGEEPPPPPPVVQAPPPPPPPPPPPVTSVEELMQQLGIDERVRMREEQAPSNDPARIAVLRFFDAFVRGNHAGVRGVLSMPDQIQLDDLVASGGWETAIEGIRRVDVRTGRSPQGDQCVLAIFHVGMDFQPQLWLMEIRGGSAEFDALPTPPEIMNRLSGADWIAAWFQVNAEELARADEPDEVVAVPQRDLTEQGDGGAVTGGGSPISPGGPGRRMPGDGPGIPPPGNPFGP